MIILQNKLYCSFLAGYFGWSNICSEACHNSTRASIRLIHKCQTLDKIKKQESTNTLAYFTPGTFTLAKLVNSLVQSNKIEIFYYKMRILFFLCLSVFLLGKGHSSFSQHFSAIGFFLSPNFFWQTDKQSSGLTSEQTAGQSSGSNYQWSN